MTAAAAVVADVAPVSVAAPPASSDPAVDGGAGPHGSFTDALGAASAPPRDEPSDGGSGTSDDHTKATPARTRRTAPGSAPLAASPGPPGPPRLADGPAPVPPVVGAPDEAQAAETSDGHAGRSTTTGRAAEAASAVDAAATSGPGAGTGRVRAEDIGLGRDPDAPEPPHDAQPEPPGPTPNDPDVGHMGDAVPTDAPTDSIRVLSAMLPIVAHVRAPGTPADAAAGNFVAEPAAAEPGADPGTAASPLVTAVPATGIATAAPAAATPTAASPTAASPTAGAPPIVPASHGADVSRQDPSTSSAQASAGTRPPAPQIASAAAQAPAASRPAGGAGSLQGEAPTPVVTPLTAPSAPGPPSATATVGGAGSAAGADTAVSDQVLTVLSPLRAADGTHAVTLALAPEGLGGVQATVTVGSQLVAVTLWADSATGHAELARTLAQLHGQLADGSDRRVVVELSDFGSSQPDPRRGDGPGGEGRGPTLSSHPNPDGTTDYTSTSAPGDLDAVTAGRRTVDLQL
jgi:flagellar hook-length control protein FliK